MREGSWEAGKQWRKLAAVRERSLGSGQIAEEAWSGKRVRLGSGQRAEEA